MAAPCGCLPSSALINRIDHNKLLWLQLVRVFVCMLLALLAILCARVSGSLHCALRPPFCTRSRRWRAFGFCFARAHFARVFLCPQWRRHVSDSWCVRICARNGVCVSRRAVALSVHGTCGSLSACYLCYACDDLCLRVRNCRGVAVCACDRIVERESDHSSQANDICRVPSVVFTSNSLHIICSLLFR